MSKPIAVPAVSVTYAQDGTIDQYRYDKDAASLVSVQSQL